MRVIFSVLLLVHIVVALNAPYQKAIEAFQKFKIDFNKHYPSIVKEISALYRFIQTFQKVEQHNLLYEEGLVDFYATINQFADLTDVEKSQFINGTRVPPYEFNQFNVRPKEIVTVTTTMFPPGPPSVDWRAAGHVTPVKDQGYYCNSCWAFSAVAALESALSIKYGNLTEASEQNLIDCNLNAQTGSFGCKGGSQAAAYMYIQYQPGISSALQYPYLENVQHEGTHKCQYSQDSSIGTTTGYARIRPYNETLLKDVVASVGPVAFGMNSEIDTFSFYGGGIYDDPKCTPGSAHSALIYGYGTARLKTGKVVDYWLCKNSWSTSWGDKGYFKMVRGKNMCGLTSYLIYPLV